MNIVAVISNDRGKYEERYTVPYGTDDDTIWDCVEGIINNFNNTLRPGELPRTVVEIYEDDFPYEHAYPLAQHDWQKSNLVTIMKGHSSYDTYKCSKCGITGKRYGLGGSVRRDKKYTAEKYNGCTMI